MSDIAGVSEESVLPFSTGVIGEPAKDYTEAAGKAVFNREEFTIRIALGAGSFSEEIWTTDLSHDYVKINAEYRS